MLLRALAKKIIGYCTRFATVLTRPLVFSESISRITLRKCKYDPDLIEYFVETSDTVKVRRRDLEIARSAQSHENGQER